MKASEPEAWLKELNETIEAQSARLRETMDPILEQLATLRAARRAIVDAPPPPWWRLSVRKQSLDAIREMDRKIQEWIEYGQWCLKLHEILDRPFAVKPSP
jgi:hypothetical protein